MRSISIRPILAHDNEVVAGIIRTVMASFGVSGPGTAMEDSDVDYMAEAYPGGRTQYFVLDDGDQVLGGGGFAPLVGGDGDTCEVRKMYLLPEARGFGYGRQLLAEIIRGAAESGYRRCYLETVPQMTAAQNLYRSMGFVQMDEPLGDTGHCACDVWYVRDL